MATITKQQALDFLSVITEIQDNTVDDYFNLTHAISKLISGDNDNNWILELSTFTHFILSFYIGSVEGHETHIAGSYSVRIAFETNYPNRLQFTLHYSNNGSTVGSILFYLYSNLSGNSKIFYMTKPTISGNFSLPSITEILDDYFHFDYTGSLTLFDFKRITDDRKLYLLRTAYLNVDNEVILNEPNKASSFGLAFISFISLLKNTENIARYRHPAGGELVVLNDIESSLNGLLPSSAQYNYYHDCLAPQFFKTVHHGIQTDIIYFCSQDFEFNDSDYEEWNSDDPLGQCSDEFVIDCEDCNQINAVFRSIFNAFQMISNNIESEPDDMPDYTQILTNINTNLANIHSDLHATVLDEQDNPVDMNVPQALVEVNNSIQADSDKPVIVGNEDLSPWSAV